MTPLRAVAAFRGADAEYWDEFTSWDLAVGALPNEA